MSDLIADIAAAETAAKAELAAVRTPADLEGWRVRHLGTKGRVAELFERMKSVPADQKKEVGRRLNGLKGDLTASHADRQKTVAAVPTGPAFDWTLPPLPVAAGRPHLLTRVRREIVDIFERMGFREVRSREVEDEFHNFTALNIPASHPARDPRDNFYLTEGLLLRSQTSTAQIRVMETHKPPVRVIHAGRVYRPDEEDRTHTDMFHQIEALYVDRGVTMAHLKRCILLFARTYFGEAVQTRFRPSFFPFTEPSAEVDVTCVACNGSGCRTCKGSGWIEMGGCGMVDPNVFDAVGYDPEEFTGFAFGLGIERIAMRKYGLPDIRLLSGREFEVEDEAGQKTRRFGNDLRFLSQF
jgi:phenylalanyl-tRNA synthetase alpha chain